MPAGTKSSSSGVAALRRPEAGVRLAGRDRERDVEVQLDLGPEIVSGSMPASSSEPVQQRARAGAGRAPRDAQRAPGRRCARRPRGLPGGHDQALLAPPQVDEHRVAAGEHAARERRVVLAAAVAQVQRGAVGAPGHSAVSPR